MDQVESEQSIGTRGQQWVLSATLICYERGGRGQLVYCLQVSAKLSARNKDQLRVLLRLYNGCYSRNICFKLCFPVTILICFIICYRTGGPLISVNTQQCKTSKTSTREVLIG